MTVVELEVGPAARVYAEGWQSWSPTSWAALRDPAPRPATGSEHLMRFRPGAPLPDDGVQGEGLVVVDPGDGAPCLVVATRDVAGPVPSVRVRLRDAAARRGRDPGAEVDVALVEATGPVETWWLPGPGEAALAEVGELIGVAAAARTGGSAAPPRVWCTWYRYFEQVTAADVLADIAGIDAAGLPVDTVQVDDGWSTGTGAWTRPRPGFGSLAEVIAAVHDGGRRAGIWLAPFVVGAGSEVAREHPDWLTGPAGRNWGDDIVGLDATHPGVRGYLTAVLESLRELGIGYLKLDFLYAGAVPGRRYDGSEPLTAYRSGLELVREVMGPQVYLLGCGAPMLPSVGLVDAMRVSSDTFHEGGEDGSAGLRGRASLEARGWQHGRWWTTDPDCLVASPRFVLRGEWARVLAAAPGVRGFSDRIAELDHWGLAAVRAHLAGDT